MKKVILIIALALFLCGCNITPAPKKVQDLQECIIYNINAYQTKYPADDSDAEYQELAIELVKSCETILDYLKGGE